MKRCRLPLLTLLVGAAVGLLLGYLLRKNLPSQPADQPNRETKVLTNSPANSRDGFFSQPGTSRSKLVSRLRRELEKTSGTDRWRHWWKALEEATLDDYRDLMRLAKDDSEALRIIGTRWIQEDPQHVFDTIFAERHRHRTKGERAIADLLFRMWAWRDAEGMLSAVNNAGSFPDMGPMIWKFTILDSLAKANPELAIKTMSDWTMTLFMPSEQGIKKWAAKDPRHAAEFTLQHPGGETTKDIMQIVGQEWARKDAASALDFAVAQADSFSEVMARAVMLEWANTDRASAEAWLARAEPAVRDNYAGAFVEAWSKSDPNAAIRWCQKELQGSNRRQAIEAVVKGVGETLVAAELVTKLEPSPTRSAAALGVANKWIYKELESQSKAERAKYVAWLEQLDADSINQVLTYRGFSWALRDLDSISQVLTRVDPTVVPEKLYSSVGERLALNDMNKAVEWLDQIPASGAELAGAAVFGTWHFQDPDAARQWLDELPRNDPRKSAYLEGAIKSLIWLPQAVERLTALSEAEQTIARKVIAEHVTQADHRNRLLTALRDTSSK